MAGTARSTKMVVVLGGLFIVIIGLQVAILFSVRDDAQRSPTPLASQEATTDQLASNPAAGPDGSSVMPPVTPDSSAQATGQPGMTEEWNPFAEMRRMREEMNRLFDGAIGRVPRFPASDIFADAGHYRHALELDDIGDSYQVTVSLGEMKPDDVTVSVKDRTLTVKGSREESAQNDDNGEVAHSQVIDRFQQSILLPTPVDAAKMTTSNRGQALVITLPKSDRTAELAPGSAA